jgi:methylmalonyl-CoA/ethylmalonyl-CoA epimerase
MGRVKKRKIVRTWSVTGLNHVGIAVKNLDQTTKIFREMFGLEPYDVVDISGLKIALVKTRNCIIELMEPLDKSGTVAKFLEREGRNAIHHVAFAVDKDLDTVGEDLKNLGVKMIYPKAKIGAMGHPVNFCHPEFTSEILVELCDVEYENRKKRAD